MAVEGFLRSRKPVDVKVCELTPASRAVNVKAKVVSKSEVRDIASGRDGASHKVCDALIGDETGCIYLTLWDDNIAKVKEGETISIGNGYVTLFKGRMRLNVGRYGTLEVAKEALIVEVNMQNNLSSKVYEQQRRLFRGRSIRDFGEGKRRGRFRQKEY
ncbi:MAG: OB-fold nucleic acid binding domain-containing protein [Candidatus Bathyarchaeia archaeon]